MKFIKCTLGITFVVITSLVLNICNAGIITDAETGSQAKPTSTSTASPEPPSTITKATESRTLCDAIADDNEKDVNTLLQERNLYICENKKKVKDYTPMHIAIKNKKIRIIYALLENGFDLNYFDAINATATPLVVYAAAFGTPEIINIFVNLGANVNSVDSRGCTPLMQAKIQNKQEVIKALSQYGAKLYVTLANGDTSLHMAARAGAVRVAVELLKENIPVNVQNNAGETPLYAAVKSNRPALINLLISRKAMTSTVIKNKTYLEIATENEKLDALRTLLENGVPATLLNSEKLPALLTAAKLNHKSSAELLLEYGLDIQTVYTDKKRNVLHLAVLSRYNEAIVWLLDFGININLADLNGMTALHLASMSGNSNAINQLVCKGACLNCLDNTRKTACDYAKVKKLITNAHLNCQSRTISCPTEPTPQKNAIKSRDPPTIIPSTIKHATSSTTQPTT